MAVVEGINKIVSDEVVDSTTLDANGGGN
ncbi:hypothetical protein CCACVL1_26426 [Corchorus capsularis]|uniref:Uncharacterized protein n=1 Tax=Corchorus capsularis TaxID=210143 RepID=A0A1R3GEV8_COCAP|nr:hypothetical protein CCACVL1_26426 [Corchorus capsularis]